MGSKLRNARIKRGWTQPELARASRIAQSAISDYERGTRLPTVKALEALVEALDSDPESLGFRVVKASVDTVEPA